MIRNLEIHNFRGFKNFIIPDAKRINVFLGKNNCGKSSILDALYMHLKPTLPQNFLAINEVRGFHPKSTDDLKMNFYNGDTTANIQISSEIDGGTRTLSIVHAEKSVSEMLITDNNEQNILLKDYTIGFHVETENGNKEYTSLSIDHNNPKIIKIVNSENFLELQPVHYVTPSGPYRDMEKFFAAAVKNKQESFISKVLHKVDDRINDVVIAGDQILVDVGLEQRIPIQLMGDGMRKMLALIVNINDIPNGYLLIDEIDNGLHYTAMEPMWKAIIEISKAKNVQIFATTHNIDSLKALNTSLSEYDDDIQDELSVYSIRNYSETDRKVVRSNYGQFSHLIDEELEIR